MAQSAYIYFVEGSEVPSLSVDQLKEHLNEYKQQTSKTGEQLAWDYAEAAFPYTVQSKPGEEDRWFYLKGVESRYAYIMFGIGARSTEVGERHYVQITLPDGSTHGDKSKANELCKYLARKLKGELHLFNGRIMYYYARK